MPINPATPLTFETPDHDVYTAIPWAYVVEKMNEALTPVLNNVALINGYLTTIDTKLGQLVADQDE